MYFIRIRIQRLVLRASSHMVSAETGLRLHLSKEYILLLEHFSFTVVFFMKLLLHTPC